MDEGYRRLRVQVTEVLQRVTDSIDFRMGTTYGPGTLDQMWDEWLRSKSRDMSFWQLVEAFETEGFSVPVCVAEREDGTWVMGNGHHRVAAAILTGLGEIEVIVSPAEAADYFVGYETCPETEWDEDPFPNVPDLLWPQMDAWHQALWA